MANASMTADRTPPVAATGMLIRRPAETVFEALVDPAITARFWYSSGEGRLDEVDQAQWHWDWYGFSVTARVHAVEPNRRVLFDWGSGEDDRTTVEYRLEPRDDGTTFVTIEVWGFAGSPDEKTKQAIDSAEGFSFVLAGLKAWLEHGIQLGLVPDRFPDAHVETKK